MRTLRVLFGTMLICAIAGCGDDPNEDLIAKTISVLNGTTENIEAVTKTLNDAVSQAKSSTTPLEIAKIDKATREAAELKKKAQRSETALGLQDYKARMDVIKDNVTPAQREEYAKNYKDRIGRGLQSLDAAQKKLDAALRDAEAAADDNGKNALTKLRDVLKEAQGEFEALTKRQS